MLKLDLDPDRRTLGVFTWATAIMFVLLPAWFTSWQWSSAWVTGFGALGLLQLVAGQLGHWALTRVIWVVLAPPSFAIGLVLSHVLLAVIFYLVMTPIGLVFRLIGRDAMHRRPDARLASYWIARPTGRSPASYFKLY